MNRKPCLFGRQQAAHLAAMNMRAVLAPDRLIYLAPPLENSRPIDCAVSARFQSRDHLGRFVPYASLWRTVNREYAMTAFLYDDLQERSP